MNNRTTIGIVVILLSATGLLLYAGPVLINHDIMHGYSGLEARIASYQVPTSYTVIPASVSQTNASVTFDVNYAGSINPNVAFDPTGLTCYVSQPQLMSAPVTQLNSGFQHVADTNVSTTYKSSLLRLQMTVVIQTSGWGTDYIKNVKFWIQVNQNPYSVFQSANSSYCNVIDVVTEGIPQVSGVTSDVFQVTPNAGGFDFPLTSVKTDAPPAWVASSGYPNVISGLAKVAFPITVVQAAPGSWAGFNRVEGMCVFTLDIDVLLLGQWVTVRPWHSIDIPKPPKGSLDYLVLFIILLVALGVTGVVLIKVPEPRFKIVGLVMTWTVFIWFLYLLGWFGSGAG